MNAAASLRIATPQTLREMALEQVREAIMAGRFPPGARLIERVLCQEMGVSRSVVREVLRHLEAEGFVESIPHKGPVVTTITPDMAAEIYELRALIEGAAARACAERVDATAIATLGAALDQIEAGYRDGDPAAVLTATEAFHTAIFETAGREVSREIVARLKGRISLLRAMTIATPGRATSGPAQMRVIYEAIAHGDGAEAEAAVRTQIATAARLAAEALARR